MYTKFRPITHIITGTGPVNPWPPTGSYILCARLYTNTFLDHITLNTVSWSFDSGSSPTYADANCTQQLYDLSSWNDSTPNTVLQTTGQNEYGTYVDIFTDGVGAWGDESATDFCVILGNDRVQTITDDSWKITRVEVFKVGMSNGIYRVNDNPSKGQWFRDTDDWTEFTPTPQSSTIIRPLSIIEIQPDPPFPYQTVQIGNQIWMAENLHEDDDGEGIKTVQSVIANGYELGPQTYYTYEAAVRIANSIDGWHLPTLAEWQELQTYFDSRAANARSTTGWESNGTNTLGLNIQPVGRFDPYNWNSLNAVGSEANLWCYNVDTPSQGEGIFFYYWGVNNWGIDWGNDHGNSVRLVKD